MSFSKKHLGHKLGPKLGHKILSIELPPSLLDRHLGNKATAPSDKLGFLQHFENLLKADEPQKSARPTWGSNPRPQD